MLESGVPRPPPDSLGSVLYTLESRKRPLPLDPSQKLEYRSFFIRVLFVHVKQTVWRREGEV